MRNRIVTIIICSLAILTITGACKRNDSRTEDEDVEVEKGLVIKNDSMFYGLVCDGTSDSVIVLWPFSGDPITFNSIDAKHEGKVFGMPEIGDWAGVMISSEDTTEACMIINLDMLKGTWTYPVMPVMKELQNMNKRMQRRMLADMPDSLKERFLVPREYGFTLKRSHKAHPVGTIMKSNTLEDDSPVSYPEVKRYKQWYTCNGRLLLVSDKHNPLEEKQEHQQEIIDTLDFVYMSRDSLVLRQNGTNYHFHRRQNALKANEAATKAAEKQVRTQIN